MAEVIIRHVWNPEAVQTILHSPSGGVARDMIRRGYRVQTRAVQILKEEGRWDQGRLAGSITVAPLNTPAGMGVRIGTNMDYALYVEEGTGLYGPKHARIYPKKPGGVLSWIPRKAPSGAFIKTKNRSRVFAKSTKGMRGIHFLRRALPAARGR